MPTYMSGFGNHFSSEVTDGILVERQNNPQKVPHGLYAEQLSGTAFTAERAENRRTWLYRALPSVAREGALRKTPLAGFAANAPSCDVGPVAMRWNPRPGTEQPVDFLHGLVTMGRDHDNPCDMQVAVHSYAMSRPMTGAALRNHDGEMLIVPSSGGIDVATELGGLRVEPTEIVVIPRGMAFRVDPRDDQAAGYVCENLGKPLRLPNLGPIGANGLANPGDFLVPRAWVEADMVPRKGRDVHAYTIYSKYRDQVWACDTTTPFDVYAWRGNLVPYKYNLGNFVTFGSISVDSPDPSINTVLTSPSNEPGVANVDFVAFCPRWQVMETTFRPPYFHRNVMSEFMGIVRGVYEGKSSGFMPGGASLHNRMVPHGPDVDTYRAGTDAELAPSRLSGTYAFMFETRRPIVPTKQAVEADWRQNDYLQCWAGFSGSEVPA